MDDINEIAEVDASSSMMVPSFKKSFNKRPSKWQTFKFFFYDPTDNTILGRTPLNWAKLFLFYVVFYLLLAGLFGFMLWAFYNSLDQRVPRYTLDESLIGTVPGLGFRPMPNDTDKQSTLIWYKGGDKESSKLWVETLDTFLEAYKKPSLTPGRAKNIFECDYDKPPTGDQVCDVNVNNWAPCTSENNYDYNESRLCVFLKLNKIIDWIPQFYNDTETLPEHMPADLKKYISQQKSFNPLFLNTIWLTCYGENPLDRENIGDIEYIPRQGFPGYFYPYTNAEGYLSPLVAVHFKNPKIGELINVECRAWAMNMKHDRNQGRAHFEIMVD